MADVQQAEACMIVAGDKKEMDLKVAMGQIVPDGLSVVYSQIPHDFNASYYYRVVLPLMTMERLKLPIYPIIDRNDADIPDEQRVLGFCHSEYSQIYQGVNPRYLEFMKVLNRAKGRPSADGSVR